MHITHAKKKIETCFLVYYPDQQLHNIHINNILHIISSYGIKILLYIYIYICVCVCVCVCGCVFYAFVVLDNKLYKMHGTYVTN